MDMLVQSREKWVLLGSDFDLSLSTPIWEGFVFLGHDLGKALAMLGGRDGGYTSELTSSSQV